MARKTMMNNVFKPLPPPNPTEKTVDEGGKKILVWLEKLPSFYNIIINPTSFFYIEF
jgi:hypothetical protein